MHAPVATQQEPASAFPNIEPPGVRTWIERSDAAAELLIEPLARFYPELAGYWGVSGLDEEVSQAPPDLDERWLAAFGAVVPALEARLQHESHPDVRRDLRLLLRKSAEKLEERRLERDLLLPYMNVARTVFEGIHALVDDQVAAGRREAGLVRLRRYAGLEGGYRPIAEQAAERLRSRLHRTELLGPFQGELERDLASSGKYVEGIAALFTRHGLTGHEPVLRSLRTQLDAYEQILRAELLPRCRDHFRLPPELYAARLRDLGVDMPLTELVSRARAAFREISCEMAALAPLVSRAQGLGATGVLEVLHELKKRQIPDAQLLEHYTGRISAIEALVEQARFVTLPQRRMRVRLATEAESTMSPSPALRAPRLLGNTGEMGEFVLPLQFSPRSPEVALRPDDFSFEAASWNFTVHEARPGHDLQFAAMVEHGLSKARALWGTSPAAIEGWALYCEAEMRPYLPLEAQLVCLQHRLMRAARAFLDPGLHCGTVGEAEALEVLERQVGLSPAMAQMELLRYTFHTPGQASAYFCGYVRMLELRVEAELAARGAFEPRAYHDALLAQGPLPPDLLREAVLERWTPRGPEP
jgi:hypothetical protein